MPSPARTVDEIRAAFAALSAAEPHEPCGKCHGSGESFMFGQTEAGCESGFYKCLRCGGARRVDANDGARRELGLKLREERMLRGTSLREEAARLGVPALVLSGWEFGRPEPSFVAEAPEAEAR